MGLHAGQAMPGCWFWGSQDVDIPLMNTAAPVGTNRSIHRMPSGHKANPNGPDSPRARSPNIALLDPNNALQL